MQRAHSTPAVGSKFLPDYTRPGIRFVLAGLMAALALGLAHFPPLRAVDQRAYDFLSRLAAWGIKPADEIVVVAYDEESLERMEPVVGSWPWPRMLHAPLLEYCSGASVLAMDLLLSERQWQYRESGDPLLVKTVKEFGDRILLAAHFHESPTDTPMAADVARMALACATDPAAVPDYSHVILPFDELLEACHAVGDVNVRREADGCVRCYQAVTRMGDKLYPSFALAALSLYAGVPLTEVCWESDRRLRAGPYTMPLDACGSFLLMPVTAPFPTYSAVDVIDSFNAEGQGRAPVIPRSAFAGKIVLFGSTAYGLHDHSVTAFDTATPGVWLHAMALQNLLQEQRIYLAPAWIGVALIIFLAIYPAGRRYARPWRLTGVVVMLLALYGLMCLLAAWAAHTILPVAGPVGALLLSAMALGGAHWSEERSRRSYVESLDRAKQLFTDMLVHDLKNTLAPITMSLSMRRETDAEDLGDAQFWRKDFPEIVETSSGRLMTQISALLDIRRMQEGKLQLNAAPADVNALLQRVSQAYQVATARTGLSLKVHSRLDPGTFALLDPEVFERIMSNLIWNAIKYARQGTTVQVGANPAGAGQVEIVVRNEGKPIAPSLQRELFMAFVTGPPPDDMKKIPSTGLGLTFCKLATEAHGGSIRLDSPVPGEEGGVQVSVFFRGANQGAGG